MPEGQRDRAATGDVTLPGVYLLLDLATGHCKIGASQRPEKRVRSLSLNLSGGSRLLGVVNIEEHFRLEAILHTRFESQNVRGEWFSLADDDINWILGLDDEAVGHLCNEIEVLEPQTSRNAVPGFPARLKKLREKASLSQRQLADAAGTHPDSIVKLEHGSRQPSLELAWRLARALGVTVNDLLPAGR